MTEEIADTMSRVSTVVGTTTPPLVGKSSKPLPTWEKGVKLSTPPGYTENVALLALGALIWLNRPPPDTNIGSRPQRATSTPTLRIGDDRSLLEIAFRIIALPSLEPPITPQNNLTTRETPLL